MKDGILAFVVIITAMTENENIIISTVEALIQEFREGGTLAINLMSFTEVEIFDGIVETVFCSAIENDFDEGLYYEAANDRLFFYGEPQAYSCGGRRWGILITPDLLPLIPVGLVSCLKKVATTGVPMAFSANDPNLLENDLTPTF